MIMRYAVGERDTRPWGTWEVVATGDGHVVKRITVVRAHACRYSAIATARSTGSWWQGPPT